MFHNGHLQKPNASLGGFNVRLRQHDRDSLDLPRLDWIASTPAQIENHSPWEEIVDELLASPHHGERWARHWMDIWRYSEWYGLGAQLRHSQKHLWHWRDWIIESLDADKGYDQMIREMLAGDEIAPDDPDTVRRLVISRETIFFLTASLGWATPSNIPEKTTSKRRPGFIAGVIRNNPAKPPRSPPPFPPFYRRFPSPFAK